jgi:hypothetical protein
MWSTSSINLRVPTALYNTEYWEHRPIHYKFGKDFLRLCPGNLTWTKPNWISFLKYKLPINNKFVGLAICNRKVDFKSSAWNTLFNLVNIQSCSPIIGCFVSRNWNWFITIIVITHTVKIILWIKTYMRRNRHAVPDSKESWRISVLFDMKRTLRA